MIRHASRRRRLGRLRGSLIDAGNTVFIHGEVISSGGRDLTLKARDTFPVVDLYLKCGPKILRQDAHETLRG